MPVAETLLEKGQLTKLLQSVRANDRETIRKLIANGIANLVNYISVESPDSALHLAAKANADDLVDFLLQLGADPDVVDFHRRSAAMKAAEYGHWQTVEKLAKAGGNMALTDVEGKGVLFYCIAPTQRHRKCAEIVLQQNADVNNVSKASVPVFVQAAETARDNSDICMMLLDSGANPMSRTETTGRTAVMAASLSGNAAVVKEILDRGGEVNQVMNHTKIHATHEAAKGGHVNVLQVLSAFGANFDVRDNQGSTPLHLAAQNGHGLACRFLAQRGCNPKPKNAEGQTARTLAKNGGHKEALRECRKAERFFGKSGKNIEPWAITLYDYIYVMHDSLMEVFKKLSSTESGGKISRDDFVEVLQGLSIQLPDETDLKKVIGAHDTDGNIDFKEFLTGKKFINKQYLMAAYEPKKKKGKGKGGGGRGKKGKTKVPFPICTQSEGGRRPDGGPPIIYIDQHAHNTDNTRFTRDDRPRHPIEDDSRWYLDQPGEQYAYISHAVKNVDLNTLKDAFERKKFDVNIRDKFYKTPLMIACLYGNIDLVKFLVSYGADVSAQDNFRWTPLHFACHCGIRDVVEYLLDLGANLEAKALNGTTPLMRAIQTSSLEVVQLLLQRGAKLRVENRKEETPLDIAAAYADFKVYSLIKERWDNLPVVKDKKKNKKRASARPKSTPATALRRMPLKPVEEENMVASPPDAHQRKGSILRTSSALGGGLEETEDITYSLINTWDSYPTSRDLISGREAKRDRFSWEVDFTDFKLPFLKNVGRKIEEMGEDAKD